MATSTTYPGVYIEELSSLALSVTSGASAVPVFAVNNSNISINSGEFIRINNWMEFLSLVADNKFDAGNTLHVALRAYFVNGGGHCYLVLTEQLETLVPKIDDATLLVAAGEDIKTAVGTLCKPGKNLFAIYDGPNGTNETPPLTADNKEEIIVNYPVNPFAAVYYPWLTADWAETDICPSAVMAAIYATVDLSRGVWKAPANIAIQGGLSPKYAVTNDLQGVYNTGPAINMIRVFPNTGTTPWGARTLEDSDNWRFVPVRRFFNFVESNVKKTMNTALFEPNSQPTWERVRSAIDNYLYGLWQQGAMAGSTPESSYFVQIGKDITMQQDDIDNGKMIVKVGIATARPAEFIILQFTQNMAQ